MDLTAKKSFKGKGKGYHSHSKEHSEIANIRWDNYYKKEYGKPLSKKKAKLIHASRTDKAQIVDNSKQAQKVLKTGTFRANAYVKNPNRYDIEGVDTLSKKPKEEKMDKSVVATINTHIDAYKGDLLDSLMSSIKQRHKEGKISDAQYKQFVERAKKRRLEIKADEEQRAHDREKHKKAPEVEKKLLADLKGEPGESVYISTQRSRYADLLQEKRIHQKDYDKIIGMYDIAEKEKEISKKIKDVEFAWDKKQRENVVLKLADVKSKKTKTYRSIPNTPNEFAEINKNQTKAGKNNTVQLDKEHVIGVYPRGKGISTAEDHAGYGQKENRVTRIEVFYTDDSVKLTNKKGESTYMGKAQFADAIKMAGEDAKLYCGEDSPLIVDTLYDNNSMIVVAPRYFEDEDEFITHKEDSYLIDYKQRD